MILKKLANRESPNDILKKVEIVLEEDAQVFISWNYDSLNIIFYIRIF